MCILNIFVVSNICVSVLNESILSNFIQNKYSNRIFKALPIHVVKANRGWMKHQYYGGYTKSFSSFYRDIKS